jgi:hypothetical protein
MSWLKRMIIVEDAEIAKRAPRPEETHKAADDQVKEILMALTGRTPTSKLRRSTNVLYRHLTRRGTRRTMGGLPTVPSSKTKLVWIPIAH